MIFYKPRRFVDKLDNVKFHPGLLIPLIVLGLPILITTLVFLVLA